MRLTHIEVSLAKGTLTTEFADDLDRLLHDGFGWDGTTSEAAHPSYGQTAERTYVMPGSRLVLRELPESLRPGPEDHLGFAVESEEIEYLAMFCTELSASDHRVELRYIEGGVPSSTAIGAAVFRTFFVRFLIPLWFQFECFEPTDTGGG
jgi:hypothetical protein